MESKRYKQSSEGAGLQVAGKKQNGTSSGTIRTAKSGSFGHQRLSSCGLRDDHQTKRSGPFSKSNALRQTPARTAQLQEQEKRILKFAYPHVDEIVFFENAFGFSKPTSVLVQPLWEKAVREESESVGQQHPIHLPKASRAVGKEMGTRAADKLRELVKKADKVILPMYGLEKEWENIKSSGQHNDQRQDQNGDKEASRKEFSNRVRDLLSKDALLHPNFRSTPFGAPQIADIIWELWLSTDSRRGQKTDDFIDRISAPFLWLHCLLLYHALYKYRNGEFEKMPINRGWGSDIYARQQNSWNDLADDEQKTILSSISRVLQKRKSSGGSVESDIEKRLKPR